MHHREDHLTSNTATLAQKILTNSNLYMRGLQDRPFSFSQLNCIPDELPLYLYPHEDALELNSKNFDIRKQKIHLIVPDGSWTQARKVYRREQGMEAIQCVKLPEGFVGEYQLRKTHIQDGLSTFEAIARSLGIIESKEVENKMMEVFRIMVARVIKSRTTFNDGK
jgi:DTW domain-containing protein YfiP